MNQVSAAASTAAASSRDWGPAAALEHWDLVVVGREVRGLESALTASGFQGRVLLVEQQANQFAPLPATTGDDNLRQLLAAAAASNGFGAGLVASGGAASADAIRAGWPFAPRPQLANAPGAADQPLPADTPGKSDRPFQTAAVAGWSVFTSPHTMAVHGREVSFHRALLATGARSHSAGIAGLDETGYLSAETLHGEAHLPRRVAVLGAGARAAEIAHALAQLGSEVHLAAADNELLPGDEPLASAALWNALHAAGARMHLGWSCENAEAAGRAKALRISRDGHRRKLIVDQIIVAGGARANVERLGLAAAGIRVVDGVSGPSIHVDARLATSNPRVFAVGTVCAGERCTQALERMTFVAVQNAVLGAREQFDPLLVPRVIAAMPPVAQIGLTARQAQAAGIELQSWLTPLGSPGEAQRVDALQIDESQLRSSRELGIVHAHVDRPGKIAGATLIGPHAAEALACLAHLLADDLPLAKLAQVPTIEGSYAASLAHLGTLWGAPARRPLVRRGRSSR